MRHKDLEENQLQDEEQISTVTSVTEPSVGEKRPRAEEEIKEENSPPPQQVPRPNPNLAFQTPASNLNGNYNNGAGMGMAQGQAMVQDASAMGYDALYIGDLQWVRLSLVLSSVYSSEILSNLSSLIVDHR